MSEIAAVLERLAKLQVRLRDRLSVGLKTPASQVAPREPVYTVQQVADILGVTSHYVLTLIRQRIRLGSHHAGQRLRGVLRGGD